MLKDEIKQIIDNLPDNCSIEDIQYTIYFKSKILKGLEDLKSGNIITDEEMEKKFNKWFKQ